MHIRFLTSLLCLFLVACSGSFHLTGEELQKLDPPLTRLMMGSAEPELISGTRSDGAKEYDVIIRSSNVEEVKGAGVTIGSSFSDVITARVTVSELKKILSLPSVRAVQAGSKNRPQ